ncbi:hypothetical protein GCK72_007709 [Caenorhabditis remanei]|uniref:DUF38 domain-containing protein n=1 Tax=Caenorhabditis remanei TaxID=31234 RepID=A0A6A5HHZ3_CAERE|nr:hypothetical protein GCK72_007709 [Caenorhabditis remanei]KAF1767750.1 hypothetical protein GCK72_007709 [Caenorhabditis remanei]
MSTNQPLAYQTSKAVLLYLNANLRLELAQRCLEIRTADRTTPLRIYNLKLNPMDVQINDTTYGVTLHKVPRRTEYLPEYDNFNCKDYIFYDVDQYGFKDYSVGPDDSFFWESSEPSIDCEYYVNILLEMHSLTHADLSESAEKARSDISLSKKQDMSKLQCLFHGNYDYLIPYILRHMGMKPHEMPYYYCIGLNVSTGNEKKSELVNYTCKLVDAVKYMYNKIFGNRELIITKKMEIRSFYCFRYKFQSHFIVHDLTISSDYSKVFNELGPLINSTGQHALQSLRIVVHADNDDLDHAIIKSAKVLTVEGTLSNEQLRQLSNQRVIFCNYGYQREILFLVGEWKRNTPAIGTHYSFPVFDIADQVVYDAFDDIRQLDGSSEKLYPETRETKFPHCITFKLSEEAELNVYYEQEYMHTKIHPIGYSMAL